MANDCEFLKPDGICVKWNRPIPCKPSTYDWCDKPVGVIRSDQMCRDSSIYGNTYHYITLEQVDELMNGKVIAIDDGEYGHFICLKRGEEKKMAKAPELVVAVFEKPEDCFHCPCGYFTNGVGGPDYCALKLYMSEEKEPKCEIEYDFVTPIPIPDWCPLTDVKFG